MASEGKTDLQTNTSGSPSQPIKRDHDSVDDFEHLDAYKGDVDLSPSKEGLPAQKFETYSERDDITDLSQQPAHDFGLDFPELKAFESKSGAPQVHDPLGDFLSGASGNPQHFAEPIREESLLPTQGDKSITDTLSFLQHESQHHFVPAAGDNPYSGSLIETEDYSLDDEVIRHKTPSPDLLPEPAKSQRGALDDLSSDFGLPPPKNVQPPSLDLEDFLSKPEIKPTPKVVREPSPEPIRTPSPVPVREPTPEPFREPTPEPVREPTPVRDPTPEPPPKPKAAPIPSFLDSGIVEKKPEKKEPELKPVISKPTSPPPAPPKQVSSGETKSCDGLALWFSPQRMHPSVEALVYWRDPKKSGIVCGSILVVLLSLTFFSFISVIAYVSLLALSAAFGFRIYKTVQQAIQKTSDGHPFKEILELDLTLPSEKVRQTSDLAVTHINAIVSELRRLFLVEDFIDSVKFGLGLWMLTYVGSWFNGMTLIILGVVALFTLPKVYETNKAQIDQNIELVAGKINEITAKVKAAIPIGKKAEEKKEQ